MTHAESLALTIGVFFLLSVALAFVIWGGRTKKP